MERRKLSKRLIEAKREEMLRAGERLRLLWDSTLPAFGCRLTVKGAAAFVEFRDLARTKRQLTIGKIIPPEITVDEARRRAAQIKVEVRAGHDPMAKKRAAQATARTKVAALSIGQAVEHWLADGASEWSAATVEVYTTGMARDLIPYVGDFPLAEMNRQIIMAQIQRIKRRSPSTAALMFRVIRAFVAWADDNGLISGFTLPRAKRVAPSPAERTRMPTNEQIVQIWHAAERFTPASCALLRMTILTGMRRRAVEGMEWAEVDFENGVWRVPASRMKAGEGHSVHLGPFALVQFQGIRKCGRFVFAEGERTPRRLGTLVRALQKDTGGDAGWSAHDFRRCLATFAASRNFPRDHIRAALAQAFKDRIDNAYDRHGYEEQAAAVLKEWQRHIARIVGAADDTTVVPIRRR